MIRRGYGRIINIGSQAGLVALPTESVYCMTKAAISHLTRCLAVEWGEHGITVNAVAPTFINTPGTEPALADPAFRAEVVERIAALHRIGDPHGGGRGGRVPRLTRRVARHRRHAADRRRLDRALAAAGRWEQLAVKQGREDSERRRVSGVRLAARRPPPHLPRASGRRKRLRRRPDPVHAGVWVMTTTPQPLFKAAVCEHLWVVL